MSSIFGTGVVQTIRWQVRSIIHNTFKYVSSEAHHLASDKKDSLLKPGCEQQSVPVDE